MKIAPCRCGHAKSLHYPKGRSLGKKKLSPCWLEGCKCKDYTPAKPK